MGFLSKLFHSLRAREEDEDTIFQQQQQLSNINNNNGNISRHNHHHKHNNKSSTSTTNNGSSSSRRSSLSSTNSNTSSKKSSFLKRKNSTASSSNSSSSSTNKNKNKNNKNNKDKNKDNKNIELNENIHDENNNNNNTDSSNSSDDDDDDDDDDTSSDEYNDEFTNNNLHRYNNGNNINTTTTINNNNKQRYNNNNLIDYFKMNIEDLFDLENIEMLCREAEDLNLIEYLTQESVMNELIEYIITYHEVIPKRLEYKLRQEQSLDQSSSFNNSQLNHNSNQLNNQLNNNNESVNNDEKVEVDDEKEDNEDNNEIRKSSDNVLLNNSRENNELIITNNNNDNHYEINNNMNGNHLIENHNNNNENYEMNHLNNNEMLNNNLNNNNHCSTPISSEDSFLKNNNHINTNTTTNELTINISSSPLNGNHILNNNNNLNNGSLNNNNLFTDKEEDLEIMEMATNNNNLNNNNEITNIDIHYYLLQKLNVKYPYIATEILTSTLGQYHILPLIMLPKLEIINTNGTSMDYNDYNNRFSIPNLEGGQNGKFIKNDKLNYLKKKLFSFLDKKPLNSFLVKCFVRVVIAMMKIPHLTSIVMDYIYEMNNNLNNNNFENESIILKMVNHIDLSDEISELLLMCLLYEDEEEITTIDGNDNEENKLLNIYLIPDELQKIKNLENLKLKKNIISKLCNLQSESNFSRSVTFILTTIIQYRKPITKKPPIIVEYIINREQLELIVKNTLNIVSNASSFVDNMNFIMNLILYISNNSSKLFHEDNFENIDWKAILVIVMKYLNDFVHLLNDKVAEEVLRKDNSIIYVEQVDVFNDDKAVPPLGIYRLKVIELFVILFKHFDILNVILDFELSSKLLKCEILKELIRLFFQYQSSLLHQMIIRLFIQILEDSTLQEFCNLFLFDYHFVDKLIEVHEKNQMLLKVKKFNASVSGFITNLGKIIGDKNLEPLQSNIKWQQFYQFCFDRTFLERVYRIGNNEQNITVPRSELRRVQEVKEYWRSHLQLK